ncbi:hypothetical protein ACFL0T_04195 [Candidatus Omnitrophota bacterium]
MSGAKTDKPPQIEPSASDDGFTIPYRKCTMLSDKESKITLNTPYPRNRRVMVIEVRPNEAKLYAGLLVKELEQRNNSVEYIQCENISGIPDLIASLKASDPDLILLPHEDDASVISSAVRGAVSATLKPLDKDDSKLIVGYDTPMRILNYNLFCPLTEEQWQVVKKGMAVHKSQMSRVAYDDAADAQARANAILVRELIEPGLPEEFKYVMTYKLKKIDRGEFTDVGSGRYIYYPQDIDKLKSFWPKNAVVDASAPHPDDTEIALGPMFAVSADPNLGNNICSHVSFVGWRAAMPGLDWHKPEDIPKIIDIRVGETDAGAAALNIISKFINHSEPEEGIGLPSYGYRTDDDMLEEKKAELGQEEQDIVTELFERRHKLSQEPGKGGHVLNIPEESDIHPDHVRSRELWLNAAFEITKREGSSAFAIEYVSPWAGDFPFYVYSDQLDDMSAIGQYEQTIGTLSFEANAIPGGELILDGGFAGAPPPLPRYAQRFSIEKLSDMSLPVAAPNEASSALSEAVAEASEPLAPPTTGITLAISHSA